MCAHSRTTTATVRYKFGGSGGIVFTIASKIGLLHYQTNEELIYQYVFKKLLDA